MVAEEVEVADQECAYGKRHAAGHPLRNSNLEPAGGRIGDGLELEAVEPAF